MRQFLSTLFAGRWRLAQRRARCLLAELVRERRDHRRRVSRWERERARLLARLRQSRRRGRTLEADNLWNDLELHREQGSSLGKEGRAIKLQESALRRVLEAAEVRPLRRRRRRSLERVARVDAERLLERARLEEERLDRDWDEFESTIESTRARGVSTFEKARFLIELDAIVEDEDHGREEEAREREARLCRRLGLETANLEGS